MYHHRKCNLVSVNKQLWRLKPLNQFLESRFQLSNWSLHDLRQQEIWLCWLWIRGGHAEGTWAQRQEVYGSGDEIGQGPEQGQLTGGKERYEGELSWCPNTKTLSESLKNFVPLLLLISVFSQQRGIRGHCLSKIFPSRWRLRTWRKSLKTQWMSGYHQARMAQTEGKKVHTRWRHVNETFKIL